MATKYLDHVVRGEGGPTAVIPATIRKGQEVPCAHSNCSMRWPQPSLP